jgi:predicted XRE-type DNA-binding protein
VEYTVHRLDRKSGALTTVSLSDWIAITELGLRYKVSSRKVWVILRELKFVYIPGADPKAVHRISPWAIEAGYGLLHDPRKGIKHAFDVISPAGQAWIDERWADAVAVVEARASGSKLQAPRSELKTFQTSRSRSEMSVQVQVCWLADHFAALTQDEMALLLDVSQPIVSRYMNTRADQRSKARVRRTEPLPEVQRHEGRDADELWSRLFGEVYNATPKHAEK